jgi:hypothetical protein
MAKLLTGEDVCKLPFCLARQVDSPTPQLGCLIDGTPTLPAHRDFIQRPQTGEQLWA